MKTQFEELTDSQWKVIKDLFPEQVLCTLSLRTVLDAIFWLLRTGTQWRNLDSKYPDYNAVYHHYRKWKNDGRFEQMNHRLVQMERERVGKEVTPSVLSIDSQSVKVAPFIDQDKGIDGGKRINGRKRHIFTDTLGSV